MKVKLYVNWSDREILSENEMESRLKGKASAMVKDDDEFDDWLGEIYNCVDIFNMSEEEKAQIRQKWEEECLEYAQDGLISGCDAEYELVEKEI